MLKIEIIYQIVQLNSQINTKSKAKILIWIKSLNGMKVIIFKRKELIQLKAVVEIWEITKNESKFNRVNPISLGNNKSKFRVKNNNVRIKQLL